MSSKFRTCILGSIIAVSVVSFGQNQQRLDSLLNILSTSQDDKIKCSAMNSLFGEYVRTNLDKAAAYNENALRLARKINYPKGITDAVYNQSSIFRIRGKYDSALVILLSAKETYKQLPDSTAYPDYLSEVGNLYSLKNDPENALINLLEALKIYQQKRIKKNLALLYNRFGSLYKTQKQYDSALAYYKKSYDINDVAGFKLGCSANLINIGTIYEDKNEHLTAIGYFQKALEIKEKLGDKQGIGKCLNNIGAAYMNMGEVTSAIEFHKKALALAREYASNLDIAMSYINLGFDYQKEKQYKQAVLFALKGLEMALQINDLKLIRESARVLYESYHMMNDHEKAFRYLELFKQYSDSIVNENNLKALTEIQSKYNVATKEKEITELKIEKSRQELQIQTYRGWYNLAIGLFISVIAVAMFFYYRARISKRLSLKLKEINDMKSHFFANLSHEFRTPLTLLLGPTEKLMETAAPADKPWLELIHRNASRLLFLDEQLLEFTRIDSGSQKIHLVYGNILVPLESIASSYELLAGQKGLRYSWHFPGEPLELYFDADILEKVTGNLLSNAFKYTLKGGMVSLSVSVAKAGDNPGIPGQGQPGQHTFLKIDITDTGIGVPESKQEVIFERFYRLNHNPGNTIAGVGIGLALTRELLTLHHGSITLESQEDKGSTFSVYLPMDRNVFSREALAEARPYPFLRDKEPVQAFVEGSPAEVRISDGDETGSKEADHPQVLVVDDNADMRAYIRQVLADNFSISDAENGDLGFEMACSSIPDLVITDVMMYPVNGIELCRNLKNDIRTSHIPVIMLTALSGSIEKIEGLETGADDYITKPFSPQELNARIRNLVQQRKKLQQLFSSSMMLEPNVISVTSADERFLQKLIALIEENMDNSELDIENLLTGIAMSRSQLHRKIKALTGQPITGFIRIIRIKRAAQLMNQKFGNVSEIMYAVGFNNLSYFTKSFREVYNMTPSEFMAK
jgi:signal transduction histidine kinase/DNA-binding response OmpR family regulator